MTTHLTERPLPPPLIPRLKKPPTLPEQRIQIRKPQLSSHHNHHQQRPGRALVPQRTRPSQTPILPHPERNHSEIRSAFSISPIPKIVTSPGLAACFFANRT